MADDDLTPEEEGLLDEEIAAAGRILDSERAAREAQLDAEVFGPDPTLQTFLGDAKAKPIEEWGGDATPQEGVTEFADVSEQASAAERRLDEHAYRLLALENPDPEPEIVPGPAPWVATVLDGKAESLGSVYYHRDNDPTNKGPVGFWVDEPAWCEPISGYPEGYQVSGDDADSYGVLSQVRTRDKNNTYIPTVVIPAGYTAWWWPMRPHLPIQLTTRARRIAAGGIDINVHFEQIPCAMASWIKITALGGGHHEGDFMVYRPSAWEAVPNASPGIADVAPFFGFGSLYPALRVDDMVLAVPHFQTYNQAANVGYEWWPIRPAQVEVGTGTRPGSNYSDVKFDSAVGIAGGLWTNDT